MAQLSNDDSLVWGDLMFIHLGNNHVIQSENIVTIIEQGVISSSSIMEEMVENMRKESKVYGPMKNAKSVVITSERVYFSTLSVPTLKKRAKMTDTISKLEDYSDEIDVE